MNNDEMKKNSRREGKMTDEEIIKGLDLACSSITGSFMWTVNPFPILRDYIHRLQSENAVLRERLDKAYEFPVKYGDKIWVLDGKYLFDRYVWAIEIKSNGVFLSLSEKTMWYDRGIVSLSERGKTWFLDSEKELAEARMKELKGE